MVIAGPSKAVQRFLNSLIIGFGSTFLAIFLGTLAAYGFSRFKVPLADDLLFFILSTRMLPPIAVAMPIYMMYRELSLNDTHIGMILLYTAVNVSLAVWLLKGFIDEIPREYEEAALVDGYTRLQAFRKVVLPQAVTGIAATAIFCLIFSWNEYAFALLLTNGDAQTMPPFIPFIIGEGGQDWPAVAAATTLFLVPIVIFTIVLRKHLAARHHLRSGAQMSGQLVEKRPGWSRWFRRGPWENGGDGRDRPRHRHADAALLARPLQLLLRDDPGRYGRVRRRQPLSEIGARDMAQIRVEGLHKAFQDFVAVEDSTFTVEDGTFFVMLGPSGCGKTTTLRMIAGLELPTEGRILLDGEDVTFKPRGAARHRLRLPAVRALSAYECRAEHRLPAEMRRRRRAARSAGRVRETARLLRIEASARRSKVSKLSGGDRQRVALGPRHHPAAEGVHDGRTSRRARRRIPPPDVRRAARPARPHRRDDRLCHA